MQATTPCSVRVSFCGSNGAVVKSVVTDAIMNPAAALQSTAEDFLESLSASPGRSLAELINCILRSCGCNDSVDEDRVVDYDGVVDALDDFTEILKKVSEPSLAQDKHSNTAGRMIPRYTL